MYRFVKIVEEYANPNFKPSIHKNWFLLVTPTTDLSEIELSIQRNRIENAGHELIYGEDRIDKDERVMMATREMEKYTDLAEKYESVILVRQTGSWMALGNNTKITDQVYSDYFPTNNDGAEIVVCENSVDPEAHWISYLSERFGNRSVKVISNFGDRSIENIEKEFEGVKWITFSTTFSSLDWFKKLIKAKGEDSNSIIMGYTMNFENLSEINKIAKYQQIEWVDDEVITKHRGYPSDAMHYKKKPYNIQIKW